MSNETLVSLPAGANCPKPASPGRRLEASHAFRVQGHVDRVFGLFDAVSERDWVIDWEPEAIYPEELSRADGTVFSTARDGRTAVWTVLRYSPAQHVAEYLVTEYDYQQRWISVSCSAAPVDSTDVTVRYVTTALTQVGQRELERYGKEFLRGWQEPVQSAVDQMVP